MAIQCATSDAHPVIELPHYIGKRPASRDHNDRPFTRGLPDRQADSIERLRQPREASADLDDRDGAVG